MLHVLASLPTKLGELCWVNVDKSSTMEPSWEHLEGHRGFHGAFSGMLHLSMCWTITCQKPSGFFLKRPAKLKTIYFWHGCHYQSVHACVYIYNYIIITMIRIINVIIITIIIINISMYYYYIYTCTWLYIIIIFFIYNYHNFMYTSTLEGSKPTWNWWKVQSFNLARYTPWSCFLQTSSNIFGLRQAKHGLFAGKWKTTWMDMGNARVLKVVLTKKWQ